MGLISAILGPKQHQTHLRIDTEKLPTMDTIKSNCGMHRAVMVVKSTRVDRRTILDQTVLELNDGECHIPKY